MIIDTLDNAALYAARGTRLAAALDYLRRDFAATVPGRYEIDGANLYALVQEYQTKPPHRYEAHRKYLDIQFLAAGVERIGWAPLAELRVTTPYDETKDVLFLQGEGSLVTLRAGLPVDRLTGQPASWTGKPVYQPTGKLDRQAGSFAILWPNDAHMPGVALDEPQLVKKVVVKVLVK